MSELIAHRRRIVLDMQLADHDPRILSDVDPARIVDHLASAAVNGLVLWCKDGWGHTYYPGKIGLLHPGLHGRDFVGDMITACRHDDIAVIAYYIVGYDAHVATQHEQWVVRHGDGETSTPPLPCINSPYRDIALTQLREIVSLYDVAGVWLDMLNFPSSETRGPACYCDYCQRLFYHRTGLPIPTQMKPGSAHWQTWQDFRSQTWLSFLEEARRLVKSIKPQVEVSTNYLIFGPFDWQAGHSWRTADYCDYLSAEAYPKWFGDLHISVLPRMLRAAGHGKPFELILLRYTAGWDWTLTPLPRMMAQAMIAMANGGIVAICDHLMPFGTLQQPVYDQIGAVYARVKELEPYCADPQPVKYAALVYSERNKDLYAADDATEYLLSFNGAFKALLELQVPFEILMEDDLTATNLADYRVVVLPNNAIMSDDTAQLIDAAHSGGIGIVATHETSLYRPDRSQRGSFALQALGGQYAGAMPYSSVFLLFGAADATPLTVGVVTNMAFAVKTPGLKVLAGDCGVGHIIYPLLGAVDHLPDEPPGDTSMYPAVVIKTQGPRSVYFPADVAASFAESSIPEAGQLLKNAILYAGGDPPMRAYAPVSVEAVFYRQYDQCRLVVHLINYPSIAGRSVLTAGRSASLPVGNEIPTACDIYVAISKQGNWLPTQVSSVELGALPLEDDGDRLIVRVPQLKVHDILVFQDGTA